MLATAPNDLTSRGFTALINPNQGNTVTIANPTPPPANITIVAPEAPAVATAIRDFVNAGGRYVGDRANGVLWARNAGLTNLNTTPTNVAPFNDQCYANQPSSLQTPGTYFTGTYDTSNPVSWGFDNGGFIYRAASSDPVYDPATLGSSAGPPAVPSTNVAISYSNPLTAFGYTCNAVGPGELPGRPVVTDSALGAGHSTVIGVNPYYRSWNDFEWRWVLNGATYPTGPSIPAGPAPRRMAGATAPASEPLPKSELPKVANRPLRYTSSDRTAARVISYDGSRTALRKALRKADVPKSVRRKAVFHRGGRRLRGDGEEGMDARQGAQAVGLPPGAGCQEHRRPGHEHPGQKPLVRS